MNKTLLIEKLYDASNELKEILDSANFQTYGKDGAIHFKKIKGKTYCFYYSRKDGKQIYLKKTDEKKIKELSSSYYAKRLKAAAEKEKKQIDSCIAILKKDPDKSDVDTVFDRLPEAIKANAVLSELTSEGYARKWQESNGIVKKRRTHKMDDYHKYKTLRGDYVGSKSEVIIADRLFMKGIPYHYEIAVTPEAQIDESRPVFDQNGRVMGFEVLGYGPDSADTLHPDFYVLNKRTRKAYFWEHLGRMDDAEYCKKNFNRFMRILDAGYVIGEDLIVTHEDSKNPLKTEDIENIIVGVIELIIIDNINKALTGATVTVQHTHSYCFERDQKDVADTRLMKRYLIFGLTCSLVLASIIGIIVLTYFNSKAYLGKQYKEIYSSPYLSGTKREILSGLPHHNYSPNQV